MIEKLKEETRELHEQVERENLARFIMDHSIDRQTYTTLLIQNYLAYRQTEEEIGKFLPELKLEKHLKLEKDLRNLGATPEDLPQVNDFQCSGTAEALGAAYVVEGSALGGMLLSRHLKSCKNLDISEPEFFSGDKSNLKDWQHFKEVLAAYDFSEKEKQAAIEKARETFEFFGRIFRSSPRASVK